MHTHTQTHTNTHNTRTLTVPDMVRQQYEDNLKWIREAGSHQLVRMVELLAPGTAPSVPLCEAVSVFDFIDSRCQWV